VLHAIQEKGGARIKAAYRIFIAGTPRHAISDNRADLRDDI